MYIVFVNKCFYKYISIVVFMFVIRYGCNVYLCVF